MNHFKEATFPESSTENEVLEENQGEDTNSFNTHNTQTVEVDLEDRLEIPRFVLRGTTGAEFKEIVVTCS